MSRLKMAALDHCDGDQPDPGWHIDGPICDSKADNLSDRLLNYATTTILCYSWVCLGLYSEILGPSLPTLMHQTQCNYEEAGQALSTRSIGLLTGSLLGGWLADRLAPARSLLMATALLGGSMTSLLIPWCTNLPSLAAVLFVAGTAHGVETTSGNPLLASIWAEKSSGPFSLMHAGYGLGGALAPLLLRPFSYEVEVNASSAAQNLSSTVFIQSDNSTTLTLVHAVAPFGIVAGFCCTCALLFVLLYLYNQQTGRNSPIHPCRPCGFRSSCCVCCEPGRQTLDDLEPCDVEGEEVCTEATNDESLKKKVARVFASFGIGGLRWSKLFLALLAFLMFYSIVGNERVFGKFLYTYALYGPTHVTASIGYYLNLVYWICFYVARLVSALLTLWMPPMLLLGLLVCGTMLTSIGLVFAPAGLAWFYALTSLFGLFKSPLFPATLGVINQTTEITGLLILVVNVGSATGAILMQYVAGRLIEYHGPETFPIVVCGTAVLVVIAGVLLLTLVRYMGNRFVRESLSVKQDPTEAELTASVV